MAETNKPAPQAGVPNGPRKLTNAQKKNLRKKKKKAAVKAAAAEAARHEGDAASEREAGAGAVEKNDDASDPTRDDPEENDSQWRLVSSRRPQRRSSADARPASASRRGSSRGNVRCLSWNDGSGGEALEAALCRMPLQPLHNVPLRRSPREMHARDARAPSGARPRSRRRRESGAAPSGDTPPVKKAGGGVPGLLMRFAAGFGGRGAAPPRVAGAERGSTRTPALLAHSRKTSSPPTGSRAADGTSNADGSTTTRTNASRRANPVRAEENLRHLCHATYATDEAGAGAAGDASRRGDPQRYAQGAGAYGAPAGAGAGPSRVDRDGRAPASAAVDARKRAVSGSRRQRGRSRREPVGRPRPVAHIRVRGARRRRAVEGGPRRPGGRGAAVDAKERAVSALRRQRGRSRREPVGRSRPVAHLRVRGASRRRAVEGGPRRPGPRGAAVDAGNRAVSALRRQPGRSRREPVGRPRPVAHIRVRGASRRRAHRGGPPPAPTTRGAARTRRRAAAPEAWATMRWRAPPPGFSRPRVMRATLRLPRLPTGSLAASTTVPRPAPRERGAPPSTTCFSSASNSTAFPSPATTRPVGSGRGLRRNSRIASRSTGTTRSARTSSRTS